MYDIHSHFLPGIDDGPSDVDTAVEMAKMAVECGVTHLVCTPHIHIGRYDNDVESINQALTVFKTALREQSISLEVAAAAEIRLSAESMYLAKQKKLPCLGSWKGKRVVLIELPPKSIPIGVLDAFEWFMALGYLPMLAHPERNTEIASNPDFVSQVVDMGCLVQVTAASFTGHFGGLAKEVAIKWLVDDLLHVVASDAHNVLYRPPVFKEARECVQSYVGEAVWRKLVNDTPQAITAELFSVEAWNGVLYG